ncbi:CDP-alcohol phosphatidyltransferase family protein [Candidatus Micrarchaeota archaeon]|nr:CDP-alcohol phosphatidyltransferase family protein [Candidatus Micrarchaeota archaeon]
MLKQESGTRKFQESVGRTLAFIPLRPNHWTVLALLFGVLGAFSIALLGDLPMGILFFVLGAATDMVDGAVARARNEATKFGGFLDGVTDRFMEALFLFAFMFSPLPEILLDAKIWLAGLVFMGTCMPSYIRAYSEHHGLLTNAKAKAMGGLLERSERLILLILGLAAGVLLGMDYFVSAVILAFFLSCVTVLQRIWYVMHNAMP